MDLRTNYNNRSEKNKQVIYNLKEFYINLAIIEK